MLYPKALSVLYVYMFLKATQLVLSNTTPTVLAFNRLLALLSLFRSSYLDPKRLNRRSKDIKGFAHGQVAAYDHKDHREKPEIQIRTA